MRSLILAIGVLGLVGCAAPTSGFEALGPGPVNPLSNPIGAAEQMYGQSQQQYVTVNVAKQTQAAEAKSFTKPTNNSFDFK